MSLTAATIGAIVLMANVASATSAPTPGAALPDAAATDVTCRTNVGAISPGGHYHGLTMTSDLTAPVVGDRGAAAGASNMRTLATGSIDYVDHPGNPYVESWHFGTTYSSLFLLRARGSSPDPADDYVSVERVAPRWGGFRGLVHAGQPGERVNTLYGLHDNGTLYRYQLIWDSTGTPSVSSYGSIPGFGDIKTTTLVSHTSTYDALLANTAAGQLITIKIPTTPTMHATRTVIRARTWGGLDQFAVGVCGEGTMLVATNTSTGAAYGYHLGFLTDTSTPIAGWGQLLGQWPYDVLTSSFDFGVFPRGA